MIYSIFSPKGQRNYLTTSHGQDSFCGYSSKYPEKGGWEKFPLNIFLEIERKHGKSQKRQDLHIEEGHHIAK